MIRVQTRDQGLSQAENCPASAYAAIREPTGRGENASGKTNETDFRVDGLQEEADAVTGREKQATSKNLDRTKTVHLCGRRNEANKHGGGRGGSRENRRDISVLHIRKSSLKEGKGKSDLKRFLSQ